MTTEQLRQLIARLQDLATDVYRLSKEAQKMAARLEDTARQLLATPPPTGTDPDG